MPSFPVGGEHKQVAEVPRAFGTIHRMADVVHDLLVLRGIGHVHEETSMTAVDVILPSENSVCMDSGKRADAREKP